MSAIILVPGWSATQLYSDKSLTRLVWPDWSAVIRGELAAMELAHDGVSPLPPLGRVLYPGDPIPAYWDVVRDTLRADPRFAGWDVSYHGYDWRMDSVHNAPALVNAILGAESGPGTVSIVAHSYGGLLARRAWSMLLEQGKDDVVRRIVTLGTPHWGTYLPVVIFSLVSEWGQQLGYAISVVGGNALLTLATGRIGPRDPRALAQLAASWPSVYELGPSLLAPDADIDPHRAEIYRLRVWTSGVNPSRHWMDVAVREYQPFFAGSSSVPPSWVLTTVGAQGYLTADLIVRPEALGSVEALAETDLADSVVTISSALISDSARVLMACAHSDMPATCATTGMLADLIADPRAAPAPPPPGRTDPGYHPHALYGPPWPMIAGSAGPGGHCAGSWCRC